MQSLEIPTGIWINLALLLAAAGFVRYKLAAAGEKTKRRARKHRRGPDAPARRAAPADR